MNQLVLNVKSLNDICGIDQKEIVHNFTEGSLFMIQNK